MIAIVREALDAGAVGFATSKAPTHVGYGGRPVPSRAADVAEIKALAGALKEAGRGVMPATIGKELFLDEFAEIARERSEERRVGKEGGRTCRSRGSTYN